MDDRSPRYGRRAWLGPALIAFVALVGGGFLEAAADDPREDWFLRAFMLDTEANGLDLTRYACLHQL